MTERWRCFVAVPLDAALRSDLSASVSRWRREPLADAMRWADPAGWHLTLAFLGSIPAEEVGAVGRSITEVAGRHGPTEVTTGRLGAFHRPGSARTLWYGVHDANGALAALAGDLARSLGLTAEEPYRPHITLARARRQPVDLRGWIEAASDAAPSGILEIRGLDLMRSHLGHGPAAYETLASIPLTGAFT